MLAVVHILATEFFLYWTYPWLDIPMHALGGVVVALCFLTFCNIYTQGTYQKGLLITLGVVLGVGILWEIFEFVNQLGGPELDYVQDTLLDLVMDIVGGCIGYLCARASMLRGPKSFLESS